MGAEGEGKRTWDMGVNGGGGGGGLAAEVTEFRVVYWRSRTPPLLLFDLRGPPPQDLGPDEGSGADDNPWVRLNSQLYPTNSRDLTSVSSSMVRASFTESYAAAAAAAAGVLPSTASAAAAAAAAAAAYLHPHPYLHKPEAHFLFPGAGLGFGSLFGGSEGALKACRRRKARTVFSDHQLGGLREKRFCAQRLLFYFAARAVELATALNLSETQVKTWFQNRRMKHKKQLRKHNDDKAPASSNSSNDGEGQQQQQPHLQQQQSHQLGPVSPLNSGKTLEFFFLDVIRRPLAPQRPERATCHTPISRTRSTLWASPLTSATPTRRRHTIHKPPTREREDHALTHARSSTWAFVLRRCCESSRV
ncbi:LOW QUALITY PROTEIN: homeobox protein Hox-B3a-like [Penaeus monodon]|uniref:LOW QUALITY PROTEIN: homeobox protein Hox-B3a-like n=1 Tax=Penaeus monodon TaxID=6687 RepID=UPI0018A74442|nr:LOW QUALITY PROTEIN: homeobox protein Hox-B3a-like [Penaeus monodon]